MGVIKTEIFTDEYGVEMKRETYANGMTITCAANPCEPVFQQPTETEITQAKLDYLLMIHE